MTEPVLDTLKRWRSASHTGDETAMDEAMEEALAEPPASSPEGRADARAAFGMAAEAALEAGTEEGARRALAEITDVHRDALRPPVPLQLARWPEQPPPSRSWIVRDWLPAGRVTMLTGAGGTGKSRLALQLAAAVATGGGEGREWLADKTGSLRLGEDAPTAGAPVVYASWEDEPAEFWRRLFEIEGHAAPWIQRAKLGHFGLAYLAGKGSLWGPPEGVHTDTAVKDWLPAGRSLLDAAAQEGARLLVLDPLAAVYGGNENSRALVRAFLSRLDEWAVKHNCAVLLVAHPSKSEGAGQQYSGSTDWQGGVRSLWTMAREKYGQKPSGNKDTRPEAMQLARPKGNYAPAVTPLRLDWDTKGAHPETPALRWQVTSEWDTGPGNGAVDVGSVSSHAELGLEEDETDGR